jgi:hypothetical protein
MELHKFITTHGDGGTGLPGGRPNPNVTRVGTDPDMFGFNVEPAYSVLQIVVVCLNTSGVGVTNVVVTPKVSYQDDPNSFTEAPTPTGTGTTARTILGTAFAAIGDCVTLHIPINLAPDNIRSGTVQKTIARVTAHIDTVNGGAEDPAAFAVLARVLND